MTTTVTLGPYTLSAFEIPTTIHYGGRQRLVVHDLPGGGRVTDVLGGSDADITFGGIISGSDADTKVQLLDALRRSGLTVPLAWSEQYFLVIVAEARFDYSKPWWIPYQLRCVVQSDLIYGAAATALSAIESISADLTNATGLLSTVPTSLTTAQTAIATPGSTTLGSNAYSQSIAALSNAQTDLTQQITSTGMTLPDFDVSLAGIAPNVSAASLSALTTSSGQLASLTASQAYLGRAISTLRNIES